MMRVRLELEIRCSIGPSYGHRLPSECVAVAKATTSDSKSEYRQLSSQTSPENGTALIRDHGLESGSNVRTSGEGEGDRSGATAGCRLDLRIGHQIDACVVLVRVVQANKVRK
jgi:hypothetical protein